MKKGFTLVELLAVITILGLLALIIVPKVQKTIKDSKKNIYESSAYALSREADNFYLTRKTELTSFDGCTYDFTNNSNTCDGFEFKGQKPDSGTLNIDKNGNVSISVKYKKNCYIKSAAYNEIKIKDYNEETCKITFNGKYIPSTNNDTHKGIVYIDPANVLNKCNEENYDNTPGVKTGCMKFYIINEKSNGTLDMILDHNTSTGIKWSWYMYNNLYGPREALYQLYEDTKDWSVANTLTSANNYTMSWNYENTNNSYTIDYTKNLSASDSYEYASNPSAYKARFITVEEIANIIGINDLESRTPQNQYFFFGSLNQTDYFNQTPSQQERQRKYGWLFDSLIDCGSRGCINNSTIEQGNYGYWTASAYKYSNNYTWYINRGGDLDTDYVGSTNRGIRPVINISKNILETY